MKYSSLESKTIRPGLGVYSFYMSDRRPAGRGNSKKFAAAKKGKAGHRLRVDILLVVVAVGLLFGIKTTAFPTSHSSTGSQTGVVKTTPPNPAPATAAAPKTAASSLVAQGPCSNNTLSKFIVVSINQRHLWACQAVSVAYDSPVVTGMENLAADLTPTGTYHIYAKQTNLTLTGSDTTGSWSDPVSYWLPFLHNKYGLYGFHDATWRADSDFGNINPNSSNASHGCVELPLGTAKWLYDWASVGTAVTIKS